MVPATVPHAVPIVGGGGGGSGSGRGSGSGSGIGRGGGSGSTHAKTGVKRRLIADEDEMNATEEVALKKTALKKTAHVWPLLADEIAKLRNFLSSMGMCVESSPLPDREKYPESQDYRRLALATVSLCLPSVGQFDSESFKYTELDLQGEQPGVRCRLNFLF
jgi:hypothetical protein